MSVPDIFAGWHGNAAVYPRPLLNQKSLSRCEYGLSIWQMRRTEPNVGRVERECLAGKGKDGGEAKGFVFVGHSLRPAETAARIGWPTSPNFQYELGAVGLGMAIASLLSPLIRNRHYWLGVVLSPSIFMILAAINHLRDALAGNLASYNIVTVVPDLLIPATLAWFLYRVFTLALARGASR